MTADKLASLLPSEFTLKRWEEGVVSIRHTVTGRDFADFIPNYEKIPDAELRRIVLGWIDNVVRVRIQRRNP